MSGIASSTPTEEYLTEVSEALTYVMGEEGLSRKIVDDMRDYYRNDASERIRAATTAYDVLCEMNHHIYDSLVCLEGMKALRKMVIGWKQYHCHNQDFIAANGMDVILSVMSNHEDQDEIMKLTFRLLPNLLPLCHETE